MYLREGSPLSEVDYIQHQTKYRHTTPKVNEVLGVQISMEKEKATVMEVDRNVSKADLYGQAAGS